MKVLIIGLGSIAQKHIKVLRTIYPEVEILALRSGNSNTDIKGVKSILNLADVPKDIKFIIISNPTVKHSETISKVIGLGKPLFIEKPSLHTLTNALPLLETIKQNKTLTYVACNLRFHPCLEYVKNYIDQKDYKINEVTAYCGSYLPNWRKGFDFRTIYSANKEMGGGVHLDLIHELDYFYYLFGTPENSHKTLRSNSDLSISSVDYAHYVLDYNDFTAAITLNYFRKDTKRQLEIVFSHATLLLDFVNFKVFLDDEIVFEAEPDVYYTYLKQMKYFTTCVSNNEAPFNSFEESLEVLKICLNE